MSKNKKVVKYRKPFSINIGLVIFIIIFIYLVFNVFSYMTTTHISIYEVEQGTMAANNVYRGLIIRNERVIASQNSGALNYYMKEASRVGHSGLVCSVDENGDISKIIRDANTDAANLNQETLAAIEKSILEFQDSYQAIHFYNVSSFKDEIDSTLNEALSLEALSELSDYTQNAQGNTAFHMIYADAPGIVAYYTDGYESKTAQTVTLNDFDEAVYSKNNLKQKTSVQAGEPLYKLIENEEWQIVIPIEEKLATALLDDDTLKLRFLQDNKTAYATYTIEGRNDSYYLTLTLRNSMVRYVKDRFIEIELLLSEETGLKIPNSAITEKEFYTIPVSYFMKGGDSSSDGLLIERLDKNANSSTEFIVPTIYYKTDDYCYIDSEKVQAGDRLIKSDSSETYIVGTDTASLQGVYNVNKGYAVFKQIDLLYQSEEYSIVQTGTTYGISLYDHIALDSSKINENDLIK